MKLALVQTVADVLEWFAAHEIRSFSPVALKERQRLWKIFCASMGDTPLEDCKPAHLLAFITAQKGAKSNHTRRRIKATVSRPFNTAAAVGLIPRNPFSGVRIPDGPCGRDWTDAEYRSILRASSPYFRRLVIFLRFGGARPGEGRTLEWGQIRDELACIVQEDHKTAWTGRGPRQIHFNHVLLKLLIFLRRNKAHNRFAFVNKFGRPWTIKALTKHLDGIRKRANLPADVKMHGGRHTFATRALMNDVDIYTLAILLGHKSVKTTERYLHLAHKNGWLNEAMDRAIGRSPKG